MAGSSQLSLPILSLCVSVSSRLANCARKASGHLPARQRDFDVISFPLLGVRRLQLHPPKDSVDVGHRKCNKCLVVANAAWTATFPRARH